MTDFTMKIVTRLWIAIAILLLHCAHSPAVRAQSARPVNPSTLEFRGITSLAADFATTQPVTLTAGPYAHFVTTDGSFLVKLRPDVAPKSVENFIQLATGSKTWKHPVTQIDESRPLYNSTTFYNIVRNSIIFGGDPINRGNADSGTQLDIESGSQLQFNRPGLLAMDQSGNLASGSRFFITLRPFPERSRGFTILGEVVAGLEVVQKISNKPTRKPMVPLDPTLLQHIEIVTIPEGKQTTAKMQTVDFKKGVLIDRNFQDAAPPPTDALDANDDLSSDTVETTSTN